MTYVLIFLACGLFAYVTWVVFSTLMWMFVSRKEIMFAVKLAYACTKNDINAVEDKDGVPILVFNNGMSIYLEVKDDVIYLSDREDRRKTTTCAYTRVTRGWLDWTIAPIAGILDEYTQSKVCKTYYEFVALVNL